MMPDYSALYDIRLAHYDEIGEIMEFINLYWKKGHILATDRAFFEYEMVIDGQVNFLIAKRREDALIDGILGFLPCSSNKEMLDVWGVIWKVTDRAAPMLGMKLKERLLPIIGARSDLGVGANKETSVPLLRRICHYYTAKMKHYYCVSSSANFKIAKIAHMHEHKYRVDREASVIHLNNIEDARGFFDFSPGANDRLPYKDLWYMNRRFFLHPIYQYDIWGLLGSDGLKALMVTRRQECNGSSAIRIVDYWGEQKVFGECGHFLGELLKESEYVDFYFDGFEEAYAREAGMIALAEDDVNIIPNNFYPFQQANVDIYVDGSIAGAKYTFFKADGDQDRPN